MSQIDLNRLVAAFEPDLRVALEQAAQLAAGGVTGRWIFLIS